MPRSGFALAATLGAAFGFAFLISCGGGGGSGGTGASLVVHGPTVVDRGSQASYSASFFSGAGDVLDITQDASWFVTPGWCASVSGDGVLTAIDVPDDDWVLLSASYNDAGDTVTGYLPVMIRAGEETALVVEVSDERGRPVDGVEVLLDGVQTLTTGSQLSEGQVYVNVTPGDHTLELDAASLTDPQGGQAWVPLASRVSGEGVPLSFYRRPFSGGTALVVSAIQGQITVVDISLADVLVSPADNQWLTDGLDADNAYRTADTGEFAGSPRPVLWWRQDPTMGDTVTFTVQVWTDDDGDTRYPMGVRDAADYAAFARTPMWEASDQALFATVVYSSGASVWPLGWTCAYAGSPLGTAPPEGEYAWRVIQENPDRGITRVSKLGAFYSHSGYFYASTQAGGLAMTVPSTNADHRDIFHFIEEALSSADVLGAPFDSTEPAGYRQRPAMEFAADLAAGSGSTSQLRILYNTDEGGAAVVLLESGGGHLGILRVQAVNKLQPGPTPEPWLQGKEFLLSYFTGTDGLVTFPVPLSGGDVYYSGTLDVPDWTDPQW